MAEIFISYSRKDRPFVRELCEALVTRERETWVDLEGIPPTAEWWREIDTDLEWVRDHTRLLVRATEWDAHARDTSYLLRDKDLEQAERWCARAALHGHVVADARFSPDGGLIATASEDTIAGLWDWRSTKNPIMLDSHTRGINSIEFGGRGKYVVTSSSDGTAIVWASRSGGLLKKLQGHKGDVLYATFDRSGHLIVTASVDKTAKVWDWQHQEEPLRTLQGHQKGVTRAEFSKDGDFVLTASTDGSAKIWNWRTPEPAVELKSSGARIGIATFTPNGHVVATGDRDGWIRVWDSRSAKECASFNLHKVPVIDLAFNRDIRLIATAAGDTAKIWEWQGSGMPKMLSGHQDVGRQVGNRVLCAAWSGR